MRTATRSHSPSTPNAAFSPALVPRTAPRLTPHNAPRTALSGVYAVLTSVGLLGVFAWAGGVQAQNYKQYVTTDAQRAAAAAVSQDGIPESELIASAPERYTVKRGDTLWDISKLYLRTPWKWPALWGMNQTQIRNPHLIYPGQVLVLTRANGRARLGLANGVDGMAEQKLLPPPAASVQTPDEKLSPRIRIEPLPPAAIASIRLGSLKPFLSQPLIVDEPLLQSSGYVLTGPENRVFTAKGDRFYARAVPPSSDNHYQLYRPGKPLRDPDTGLVVAYESFYLGSADLIKTGDPSQLQIVESKEEVTTGDRLLPLVREPELTAVPRAPDFAVKARVMSSYNGVEYAGSNMVVTLNKGRNINLEVGHVLALWRTGERMVDKQNPPQGFWAITR
jgi:LysM repeat protein